MADNLQFQTSSNVLPQNWFVFVLCFIRVDAFTSLNMLLCPSVEMFTLAIKVPKGKSIHHMKAIPSRLEWQTRNNIVHVPTNRKPFMDEKKKVFGFSILPLLRKSIPMRRLRGSTAGLSVVGAQGTRLSYRCVVAVAQWPRPLSLWVVVVSRSRLMVTSLIVYD